MSVNPLHQAYAAQLLRDPGQTPELPRPFRSLYAQGESLHSCLQLKAIGRFIMLPAGYLSFLRAMGLDLAAAALLLETHNRQMQMCAKGEGIRPSRFNAKRWAKRLDVSLRTTQRALKDLEEKGYARVLRHEVRVTKRDDLTLMHTDPTLFEVDLRFDLYDAWVKENRDLYLSAAPAPEISSSDTVPSDTPLREPQTESALNTSPRIAAPPAPESKDVITSTIEKGAPPFPARKTFSLVGAARKAREAIPPATPQKPSKTQMLITESPGDRSDVSPGDNNDAQKQNTARTSSGKARAEKKRSNCSAQQRQNVFFPAPSIRVEPGVTHRQTHCYYVTTGSGKYRVIDPERALMSQVHITMMYLGSRLSMAEMMEFHQQFACLRHYHNRGLPAEQTVRACCHMVLNKLRQDAGEPIDSRYPVWTTPYEYAQFTANGQG